jgi:sugar lactone lactonase YvrE
MTSSFLRPFGSRAWRGPAGVDCHADGRLFVTDDLAHEIVVLDRDGALLQVLGREGSGPGELLYADALAWRPDGTMYVADTGANRIQVWSRSGAYEFEFGRDRSVGIARAKRLAVTFAGISLLCGLMLMASYGLGIFRSIVPAAFVLSISALSAATWTVLGAAFPRVLDNPRDIVADGDRTFVSDHGSHAVRAFDADGRLLRTIGRAGAGPGELSRPTGLALSPDGRLFVADSGHDRVQIFTRDGAFVSTFGRSGQGPGEFRAPHGMAFGPTGRLYVADAGNARIQIMEPDGTPIDVLDGTVDGRAFTPAGLCASRDGQLFVADTAGHRVLVWRDSESSADRHPDQR